MPLDADDRVMLAPSACELQAMVTKMNDPVKKGGLLIPTPMYGVESWMWQKRNENRINAKVIRSLCSICGMSLKSRRWNSDARERSGLKELVIEIKKPEECGWNLIEEKYEFHWFDGPHSPQMQEINIESSTEDEDDSDSSYVVSSSEESDFE
ncbi:hypothetical protein EVAR_78877_1 [Eumeta japonica]|uniref:Uncharacterized protein n=1 Tax=Eumeta variegata TaxID=151549 RepID=A0A4C1U2L5_EUMVA|nr:hypothetical protein EVAR_78877_1 [Eumeta japonica]